MNKLLLVDGHNLLFRMFYGIQTPILNSKGNDIRAVVGFLNGLLKELNRGGYDHLMVVFDSETSTQSRLAEDETYKGNRIDYTQVAEEDNPFNQLPYIFTVLEALGACFREIKTCEADDYIASLCKAYQNQCDITILSTDRDFLQLVNDKVKVYSPRGAKSIYFDEPMVYEKFGVNPDQIIDYKILVGDASDNIKGVKSIGPKTAIKILSQGTLDFILDNPHVIEEKHYKKIDANRDLIQKNRRLVTMVTQVTLLDSLEDMAIDFNLSGNTNKIISKCDLW